MRRVAGFERRKRPHREGFHSRRREGQGTQVAALEDRVAKEIVTEGMLRFQNGFPARLIGGLCERAASSPAR